MKKCINCGKELNDDMSFCPVCGNALEELSVNKANVPLPNVKEILDRHLQHFPNKGNEEVKTELCFMSNHHVFSELCIYSNSNNPLRIELSLRKSNAKEKEALDRFEKTDYYSKFTKNLMYADGYNGYIDIVEENDAVSLLSSLLSEVYQKLDDKCFSYSIRIGVRRVGTYEIKDGVHVLKKGCFSIIVVLIVMGATFLSLI